MSQGPTSKFRVIAAPNSMKGSLDAFRFAEIIRHAFRSVSDCFEIIELPVADGGDLTGEVLSRALHLSRRIVLAHDPLGRVINAEYGLRNQLAVIEMANASGLKLLQSSERNPLRASSIGTGELMLDVIRKGLKTILLGVGGSATIDGGMGLLEGLGVIFFDEKMDRLPARGENVGKIHSWDDSSLQSLSEIKIKIICDVDNPLLGESGAVAVFGPQKGADPAMLPLLEHNLEHFANLILQHKGVDLKLLPGMGAAGGINLALCGFLGAEIVLGAEVVLETLNFDTFLQDADLVVTGEGSLDRQTANNKAPWVVARHAQQFQVPVFAIAGSVEPDIDLPYAACFSLTNDSVGREEAVRQVEKITFERACDAARYFLSTQKK